MNRRSFLTMVIATPALTALVAACGDDSAAPAGTAGSTGFPHPTGADDIVLRLGYEGGFVAPGTLFVSLPTLLVSGDGRAFQPGAMTLEYPGRLVAPMSVRSISEAGIQNLLQLADDGGLLAPPPDYSAETNVADVPDTVLMLNANDQSFVHRAYALGFAIDANGNPAPESTVARQRFAAYTVQLSDLETAAGTGNLGATETFVPAAYRFQATVIEQAQIDGMDMEPTIVAWPADTGVALADALECGSASADTVGELFATATQITYFEEDDVIYALAVAGVLPGDAKC